VNIAHILKQMGCTFRTDCVMQVEYDSEGKLIRGNNARGRCQIYRIADGKIIISELGSDEKEAKIKAFDKAAAQEGIELAPLNEGDRLQVRIAQLEALVGQLAAGKPAAADEGDEPKVPTTPKARAPKSIQVPTPTS